MSGEPANPFLAAFFRSHVSERCSSSNGHRLFVPTTAVLVNGRDRESHLPFTDLVDSEDFLASHVILSPSSHLDRHLTDPAARDTKNKAKQFATLNGRSVVVKDGHVYTNHGFKTMLQAQIIKDVIYFADTSDNRKYHVYYISRPLLGVYETIPIVPAVIRSNNQEPPVSASSTNTLLGPSRVRETKPLADVLREYPMMARQLGLGSATSVIQRFNEHLEKPDENAISRPSSARSHQSTSSLQNSIESLRLTLSGETPNPPSDPPPSINAEENAMRLALQAATFYVLDALDHLDKQHLDILLTTSHMDRSALDQAVDCYVSEQLHEDILFPRICAIRRSQDSRLDSRIRKMSDIDIAQVGIPIEGGREGKRMLALRLDDAVAQFKKMALASSPHAMTDVLLSTIRFITTGRSGSPADANNDAEKQALAITMNADALVSMLLLVVIRSSTRHLNARLSYMRNFVLIGDVELGEIGYALSTFEAVLTYLESDSGPLQKASRVNSALWRAVKDGDITAIATALDLPLPNLVDAVSLESSDNENCQLRDSTTTSRLHDVFAHIDFAAVGGSLDHVFPFQKPPTPPPDYKHRRRKRVSMAEQRSNSLSSCHSSNTHSRRESMTSSSGLPATEDVSSDKLAQSQNRNGDSLLMMAVDADQQQTLKYLFGLSDLFDPELVILDTNTSGMTLLAAAMQGGRHELISMLLDYLRQHMSPEVMRTYVAKKDNRGRCAGHFIGSHASSLNDLGQYIPWSLKDQYGQTPLFTLCRAHDLAGYENIVETALTLAADAQEDEQPLHGDDHTDKKGNTLLHLISDARIVTNLLDKADVNVNATNDRHFTPLMAMSRYGRLEIVRSLLSDPRVDSQARDARGLSATELAKDDLSRRRIDDLMLFLRRKSPEDLSPVVVRSFFIDDGTFRLVLKSIVSSTAETITSMTCRRSLKDFHDLLRGLSLEQPASWLPKYGTNELVSPYFHPSRPSRAALQDIQNRFDRLLTLLLTHATFATHELVWEFFVVPDLHPEQLAERSRQKAELRAEKVREEMEPVTDVVEVETFVHHAQDQVRKLLSAHRKLLRCCDRQLNHHADLADLAILNASVLSTLPFLPPSHKTAFERLMQTWTPSSLESLPLMALHYDLDAIVSATTAVSTALLRPTTLIDDMHRCKRETDKTLGNLSRSSRWTPRIGLFDETHKALRDEAWYEAEKSRREVEELGAELRYTQQTVASELAGWHEARVKIGREALRDFAQRTIVREKDRMAAMRRALRQLKM